MLAPEDLVLFKVLSSRDRDLDDAASVLRRSGEAVDLEFLDGESGLLSSEVPDLDVRGRYAEVLRRAGRWGPRGGEG